MRIFSLILCLVFSLVVFNQNVEAKVLPQSKSSKPTAIKPVSRGSTISVTPRMRSDRRAILVYFSNLQNAKSVSYMLTYDTNTQQEGAMGAITLNGSRATQEFLFGTCSKNVCRYHTGIKNMRLEVSYTSVNGKKYLKKFKIKI